MNQAEPIQVLTNYQTNPMCIGITRPSEIEAAAALLTKETGKLE